ncbi:MAG TPA: DUF2752 domain-containing protein [Aequorivita sp.]|nr:DUF2752 domain-containing protein [Aequorivita sp.]
MFLKGLENYMLPCINKKIFGVECLGCGMQRATALLFQGDFSLAFKIYPAIYTILLLLAVVAFSFFVKFKYDFQLKIGLVILNAVIMVGSYFYKIHTFL